MTAVRQPSPALPESIVVIQRALVTLALPYIARLSTSSTMFSPQKKAGFILTLGSISSISGCGVSCWSLVRHTAFEGESHEGRGGGMASALGAWGKCRHGVLNPQ